MSGLQGAGSAADNGATSENHLINAVRILAAMAVVLGHIRMFFFQDFGAAPHGPAIQLLYAFASLGGASVLVFFALSGYWVGGAVLSKCRDGKFDVRDYASARLIRLWIVVLPALALTFCVDSVGTSLFGTADVYRNPTSYAGGTPLTHAPAVLLGNVFFLQDLHVPTFGYAHPFWSLSYEFWYYCLFAALTVIVVGPGRRARRIALAGVLASSIIVGRPVLELFPVWLIGAGAAALKPQAIAWAKRSSGRRIRLVRRLCAVGLVLVMAGTHLVSVPRWASGLLIGAATGALLWTLATDVTRAPGRTVRLANRLARCSFSLYAIHMPLVVLAAAALVPHRDQRWALAGPAALILVPACIGLTLLALGFAHLTEDRTSAVRRFVRTRSSAWALDADRPPRFEHLMRAAKLPRQRDGERGSIRR